MKHECPQHEKHTPSPSGYLQWHAWAEKKAKTHRQVRCPGCNLFAIWIPKKKRRGSTQTTATQSAPKASDRLPVVGSDKT